MFNDEKNNIAGKYRHFKGNYYDLFCVAYDRQGKKYVLYQQCYGNKSFWIRPFEMFFESVLTEEGGTIQRFEPTKAKRQDSNKKIKELINLIEKQDIIIHDSENETQFYITDISVENHFVIVYPLIDSNKSGYLTEFVLVRRLGFIACRINNKVCFFKDKNSLFEGDILQIDKNDINYLAQHLNPCSIDLQIAETGYLRSTRKTVDPQSIENISSAKELWKPVRTYHSKNHLLSYIKIHSRETILTHTKYRIRIPTDCAGKIEIKSTFARLSLSITSGDFCNPGYDGFFPLEITNTGKHTIVIHEGETMAQLMLIPLQGPILEDYSSIATYKNDEGFDDGTPYTFWRERSIKNLRNEFGTQRIIDIYQQVLDSINSQNTNDINDYKERFTYSFLPYCQKQIRKSKFRSRDTGLPDEEILLKRYTKREKLLKSLFGIKWFSGVFSLICNFLPIIIPFIQQIISNNQNGNKTFFAYWPLFVAGGALLSVTILLFVFSPKTFCTFEGIDLSTLKKIKHNSTNMKKS